MIGCLVTSTYYSNLIKNVGSGEQKLRSDIQRLQNEIASMTIEANNLQVRTTSGGINQQRYTDMKRKVEALETTLAQLADKETDIDNLKRDLRAEKRTTTRLTSQLADKETEIDNLKRDLRAETRTTTRLTAQLAELESGHTYFITQSGKKLHRFSDCSGIPTTSKVSSICVNTDIEEFLIRSKSICIRCNDGNSGPSEDTDDSDSDYVPDQ